LPQPIGKYFHTPKDQERASNLEWDKARNFCNLNRTAHTASPSTTCSNPGRKPTQDAAKLSIISTLHIDFHHKECCCPENNPRVPLSSMPHRVLQPSSSQSSRDPFGARQGFASGLMKWGEVGSGQGHPRWPNSLRALHEPIGVEEKGVAPVCERCSEFAYHFFWGWICIIIQHFLSIFRLFIFLTFSLAVLSATVRNFVHRFFRFS